MPSIWEWRESGHSTAATAAAVIRVSRIQSVIPHTYPARSGSTMGGSGDTVSLENASKGGGLRPRHQRNHDAQHGQGASRPLGDQSHTVLRRSTISPHGLMVRVMTM